MNYAQEKIDKLTYQIRWYRDELVPVLIRRWQTEHSPVGRWCRRSELRSAIKDIRALEANLECWK